MKKALRMKKNNQVLQAIVKKLKNFYLSYSFNLKVKSNKFVYFVSFLIQINNYGLKIHKKKHAYHKNHSKSLNENNNLSTKFRQNKCLNVYK
jgi:hypothetical protein